jgi:hypothetical protein
MGVIYEVEISSGVKIWIPTFMNITFFFFTMALQPFLGPWPHISISRSFYTDGRTPWTRDQPVARPPLIHRTTQTQKNAQTYEHPCLSRIRTYDHGIRASEDSSCLRPLGYRDRLWISHKAFKEYYEYVGVLKSLWLFLFPIFLFAAQPKECFLDVLKKLEKRSHKCVELIGDYVE